MAHRRRRLSRAASDKSAYTTFSQLGGGRVELDEVCARLAALNLDLVLGVLGRISAHQTRDENDFFDVNNQGQYLIYAIADDFPRELPGAATMYVPNRAPLTGGRHLFVHEHGLVALSQLALRYCHLDGTTAELSLSDFGQICRLLLILNDHLALPTTVGEQPITLKERRRFAVDQLFYAQFNQLGGDFSGLLALARLRKILTEHLPKHYPSLNEAFERVARTSIDAYLSVAGLMLAHAPQFCARVDRERSPWVSVDTFVGALRSNSNEVRAVLERFTQSPNEFRRQSGSPRDVFDFDALQRRPLIRAREGQMIAPVMSLLIRQLVSFPLQVISDMPNGRVALGEAYEDYAHELVKRIARGDTGGPWGVLRGLSVKSDTEPVEPLGEIDSMLWREGVAIPFEHKAGNLVLTLGSRSTLRNAVGPNDVEIDSLPNLPEKDSGAITHGVWQLARIARRADATLAKQFGVPLRQVLPLITTLQAFQIDDWARRAYLSQLLGAAKVKLPSRWGSPDWLTVSELEAMAQLADDGRLDLLKLLGGRNAHSGRFSVYLAREFGSMPVDGRLAQAVQSHLGSVGVRYFGAEFLAEMGWNVRSLPESPGES